MNMIIFIYFAGLSAVFLLAVHFRSKFSVRKILMVSGISAGAMLLSWIAFSFGFNSFSLWVIPPTLIVSGWILTAGAQFQQHLRGGVLVNHDTLKKLARSADKKALLHIGGVSIPSALESRHFAMFGTTGAGKSQAFFEVATVARARRDSAIIPDINGEMIARYYDKNQGDLILNPIDERSESWSPLAEIFSALDADRIAKSIIPEAEGSAAEWNNYARVLLAALLENVWRANGKNSDLVHLALFSTDDEFGERVAGTAASRFFAPGGERPLASIRSILGTYIKPFSYLDRNAGTNSFSITEFVRSEARDRAGAWLFIPVRDDMFEALKPLIAGQCDIAISALLSVPDDDTRRLWFFIDELPGWGRLNSLAALLTRARKKGGCAVLGVQTIAQLRQVYGRDGAQVLLANAGNWLTLRSGDPETAEFMAKAIGNEQIRRWTETTSHDLKKSAAEQITEQSAVMPAQLLKLPDLKGILNIAGELPAGWVEIPISKIARTTEPFVIKANPGAARAKPTAAEEQPQADDDFIMELLESPDGLPGGADGPRDNK